MTVIARMLQSFFACRVADLSVTRSQWSAIAVVARRPGATQRMIAEALEMSEASAGRLIDRLCADGLLERRERENDRRVKAVYVTSAAEPLLTRMSKTAEESDERVFNGFSEDELDRLEDYLDRIYANLGKGQWPRQPPA